MIKSFLTSFQIKNTYRVNSILYSVRQLPILKTLLSDQLYQNKSLKIIGNIISAFIELCSIFLGKLIYIWLCISSVLMIYKTPQPETFLHLFVFLTMAGAFVNTFMFSPTKDKYYAMILMNMDAKQYTLSNYYYALWKLWLGFLPFTIIFGSLVKLPIWICVLLPFFVISAKVIISAYHLLRYQKKNQVLNENMLSKYSWVFICILLLMSYGLPYLGITINQSVFLFLFGLFLILGILSIVVIQRFSKYKQLYKKLLVPNNVYLIENQTNTVMIKEMTSKQITLEPNFVSKKSGFSYFHELFVKRHYKILTKAVKKQCLVITCIFILLSFLVIWNTEVKTHMNALLLVYLPYFVFIAYSLNRGTTLTQAMFLNCDHSMLTYRIYRTPKVILGVFKERLKTLVTINLFPAILIGFGLCALLYLTGGTADLWNYIILFLSLPAMSIFFSIHYLVLYYLLQPYNVATEIKSSTYRLAQTITYLICFWMMPLKIPTISFGIMIIIFSIIYSFVSLFLVYRYASKTFKLRN